MPFYYTLHRSSCLANQFNVLDPNHESWLTNQGITTETSGPFRDGKVRTGFWASEAFHEVEAARSGSDCLEPTISQTLKRKIPKS